MQSLNKLNLLLLLLLLTLIGVVYWSTLPPSSAIDEQQAPTIAVDAINAIVVERQGYPAITLLKQQEQWWLQQPHLPAKRSLVDALLKLPSTQKHASYPLDNVDLDKLGLREPALCIHYGDERLCFGGRNPLDQLRYLQMDNQVHLIYDTLSHQLSGEYQDYLSTKLLPNESSIERLTLPQLTLQKMQQGWQLTPTPDDYSADQVQQLLSHWQQARALLVAAYQGGESEEQIELQLTDGEEIRFFLISSEPELILARPELGIQYHLQEGSLNKLTRLPPVDEQL